MKKWYIIHSQTGFEDKVRRAIENRIAFAGLQERVSEIVIPTEQISEIRRGRKRVSQRKFFPGYILIKMDLDETVYAVIKGTPGVTGFIGAGKKPAPLSQSEADNILKKIEETHVKPSLKVVFEKEEQVRITQGPFVNFNGTVDEIYPEKGKIKVSVSIFGRATPVELEYWQVEKM
ncbi:MAG: transcription termination/antitermination protein NusG [Candidatus Omnitrophota bacterium]